MRIQYRRESFAAEFITKLDTTLPCFETHEALKNQKHEIAKFDLLKLQQLVFREISKQVNHFKPFMHNNQLRLSIKLANWS